GPRRESRSQRTDEDAEGSPQKDAPQGSTPSIVAASHLVILLFSGPTVSDRAHRWVCSRSQAPRTPSATDRTAGRFDGEQRGLVHVLLRPEVERGRAGALRLL